LARIKYKVEKDISKDLILKNGSCKIKPLDSIATQIVKTKNILINSEDGMRLNEKLKNYQMTWVKDDKEIVFTSQERFEDDTLFIYEERVIDYKHELIYLTRY